MFNPIRWDAELIRRYDKAGPRYTSYPTALQFHQDMSPLVLEYALAASKAAGRDLSLYLHVPFCANSCYYCACNKVITKDRSRSQPYLRALYREIELVSQSIGRHQMVEQLHLGGGTPTFFSHAEMRGLMAKLRAHFSLHEDDIGDYSIEIDPREADWSTIGMLRELGFNRLSLGVQDLDPQVQRAVNRLQSIEQTQAVMDAGRTLAYRSINIDLIYGLPKQTPDSFARTLETIIELRPDRLSVFSYAHLPDRFAPQRHINEADLPSAEARLAMLEGCVHQLTSAGYRYIGMDHFALPDDSLTNAQETGLLQRNFQGYTTHGRCDLIGMGASAISQIGDLYSQNDNDVRGYQDSLENGQLATHRGLVCNADDRLRRAVISQLICHFELEFADIEQRFEIVFREYFADCWPVLEQMHRDRLLSLEEGSLTVMPAGRLLVRSICMVFDAYQASGETTRYSRVI
ncbi:MULTISPECIES: oxygen-independent coproporphyrinogen III oxidase [Pseudomonas]|uniref:oxygen-independent coproporphyrinogen III oxidase n=1 Tax=Pseudomonas TaxID=286 RepID=UPI00123A4E27|nr:MULTISPECIES: oxygen-independent coproporphyrinogen III oxidase [Pseudomonas]QIB52713.1 oxygen-independent coproporphyrinogen III oxidase [Pseudomonas sp. OIL-1]